MRDFRWYLVGKSVIKISRNGFGETDYDRISLAAPHREIHFLGIIAGERSLGAFSSLVITGIIHARAGKKVRENEQAETRQRDLLLWDL